MSKIRTVFGILIAVISISGCSIKQMVMNELSSSLGGTDVSTVITGEEDPELVGSALPTFIKTYEIALALDPKNPSLLLATSNACALYAYAFLQTPATMLGSDRYDERKEMMMRAKKLFLRARDYATLAISIRHPGFSLESKEADLEASLAKMSKDDVPYLYYAGLSDMGAFTSDSFDMELIVLLPKVVLLISRALELDETYDSGAIHEFFVSYYGSLPKDLGGSEEKARAFYKKALDISGGKKAGAYVSLASSVSINTQNIAEFRELLEKAIAVDVNMNKSGRLMNIIAQRKAKWLLDHIEDYFLIGDDENE
jgi:predicted anti-sigma-YlaC factor YlaD